MKKRFSGHLLLLEISIVFFFTIVVGAATAYAIFVDDEVIPGVASLKLGDATRRWASMNDLIYFSGGRVGIGSPAPAVALEVNGVLRLNTTNVKPSCTNLERGLLWVIHEGTSTKDKVQMCLEDWNNNPAWRNFVN